MVENERQRKLDRLERLMQQLPNTARVDVSSKWPEPEYELTMTQFKALTYLQGGPQRMGDIGRSLNVGLSSVTNVVSRLESKGLVQRTHDTRDRRVVTCELTPEGRETISMLWRIGREQILHLASRLTDDELDQVVTAFEILEHAAESLQKSTDSGA